MEKFVTPVGHYCSKCKEEIEKGTECYKNNNEYYHLDCIKKK